MSQNTKKKKLNETTHIRKGITTTDVLDVSDTCYEKTSFFKISIIPIMFIVKLIELKYCFQINSKTYSFKECVTWAEKVTQQLKAGISFIEDPSSVPSTEVR